MIGWIINLNLLDKDPRKPNNSSKKLLTPLRATREKISPKVIILSNIFLTKHEIEILKLGLCFIPTSKHNISELETDIYNLITTLCLTYHFRDST